ncbi:MAG TPA: type II CAAX endopeptidase family protein [Bryobacteraceae bacterium]|nr:type II CAAX endopeptidase family protein [Bryobacteraceae bacterium]
MSEEQPIFLAAAPPPKREPFWGYGDVILIAGLALPCMFLGVGVIWLLKTLLHLHMRAGVAAVSEMLIGYALLFGILMLIFRIQYDRPFWRSLGWTWSGVPIMECVLFGFGTTIGVGIVAWLIHSPPSSGPLMDMMKDRSTLILLAIFGTTVAPLAEELAFRGFLQPLLVRNLGAIAGVALAAALFGGLHFSEYGDSWRSALLVALAGAAFGTVRQWTGSTAAAAVMHASFNGLQFVALLTASKTGLH